MLTILDFCKDFLALDLSPGKELALRILYGLEIPAEAMEAFQRWTGLTQRPKGFVHSATFICGRRGGKTSHIGVPVLLYEALLGGHEKYLRAGERGHCVMMAQTVKAVSETMALLRNKVNAHPTLRRELVGERADALEFANNMNVSIWPCTLKAIRGLNIPVAVLDEIAFWESEGANPDREVIRSVTPAMATFPQRRLIKLTTPYTKLGVIWEDYEKYWGKPARGAPLVWVAESQDMNPAIDLDFLVEEQRRDPEAFEREYKARFSDPTEAFIPGYAIAAATDDGIFERKPTHRVRYVAGVDIAFKRDATVLCIGHREGDKVTVDVWRAWKPKPKEPLSLADLAREIALLCHAYGVPMVTGDQFASEPVREALRSPRSRKGLPIKGVGFQEVAFTATRRHREKPKGDTRLELGASKMDMYGAMRTLLEQGRLRLLDNTDALRELAALEVKRSFSGIETLGAPPPMHDDYPSALVLMVWQCFKGAELREREGRVVFRPGGSLLDARLVESDDAEQLLPKELQGGRASDEREIKPWRGLTWM